MGDTSTRVAGRYIEKSSRRQILMPADIRRKIPPIGGQENEKDPIVYVKFFNPYGAGTWLVTEFDGQDEMFGYVKGLGGDEWGYMSLRELESMPAMLFGRPRRDIQGIERDSSFRPMPFSQAKHQ